MMIINGGTVIINGRVINGNHCNDADCKKFDETQCESANGINKITIDSSVNVAVSTGITNDVTAHLHGSAITNNDFKLSIVRIGSELQITVKAKSASTGWFSFNGSLLLDVVIPNRAFQEIYARIPSGNIEISSAVADVITLKNANGNIGVSSIVEADTVTATIQNGNIDVSTVSRTLNLKCNNGNIDVDAEAKCNVKLNIKNQNGNIDVSIGNIKTSNVLVSSHFGRCKNSPKLRGIYTVSGQVTSHTGNVKFH